MRYFVTLFCYVVANLFVTFVVAQPPKSSVQLAAEKLLREMPVRIYNGKANESDLRECVKFIDIAQNDNARRPFILLAAQYNRITLNKPERALAIVAPYLIGAERAKSWQKSNDDAVKVVNAKWTKEVAAAKREKQDPPKQPPQYQVELPPPREWTIDETTALFAVEAAACFAAFDKTQRAIEIIDIVGKNYKDETRVLAAECGADLFLQTKLYGRAVEFYKFAIDVLGSLKQRVYEPGE
ncbi:MAG: hypothetical protein LBU65_14050, partial [Planctomycetaceae bacterium]|nr:hypothetical protein [Planctomycetaceae bacterium]